MAGFFSCVFVVSRLMFCICAETIGDAGVAGCAVDTWHVAAATGTAGVAGSFLAVNSRSAAAAVAARPGVGKLFVGRRVDGGPQAL